MERLAETAEVAASENEMRTLYHVYKITQQICGSKHHHVTTSLLRIKRESY